MAPHTLFIINPIAGAGRARAGWAAVARALGRQGVRFHSATTEWPGQAVQLAREAASAYELVVAVGGDGTVSEVADGLLSAGQTQAVLGMLPFGTGNDIAGSLGIRTLSEGLAALCPARTRPMDVIEVRCASEGRERLRHALGFAAVGITGDLLRRTTRPWKRFFGGRLTYYLGLIHTIWHHHPAHMRVICDGAAHEDQFLFVGASNCESFGGGMKISPGAQSQDGRLNVNLIRAAGPWETISQLRRLRHGRHIHHPKVRYFTATQLHIETGPIQEVAADGDLIGQTPALITIRPQVLRVVSAS